MTTEGEIMDLQVIPDAPLLQRDPDTEIDSATVAAKALKRVIDSREDKVVIRGKTFLRYEDWQTVGQFYGYSVQTDEAVPVEIDGIKGAKAKAILLDRHGNLAGGAEAYCMRDEDKWRTSPWFQLASMAQTRAGAKALRNRLAWVAVLAGYSGTPAEEMDGAEGHSAHRSAPASDVPNCPDCGGAMWDNRATKKGRQPDFKCKDKDNCGKAVWADSGKLTPQQAAIGELMKQAERLLPPDSKKLAELRGISNPDELGRKVQILIDVKRQKEAAAKPEDAERIAKIAEIRETMKAGQTDEQKYLAETVCKTLEQCSLDELVSISDDLTPF